MKSSSLCNSPNAIKNPLNGQDANLIQPNNIIFNINNLIQQQQIQLQQHLIQQQFIKQQNQQNYQSCVSTPINSPQQTINNQFQQLNLSPQSILIDPNSPMQSPLNASNSSTMELPIVNQNIVQCSSVNTSCDNSLITISPVSSPNGSPMNCSSPTINSSSSSPIQSVNQTITTANPMLKNPNLIRYVDYQTTINQFINHQNQQINKSNQINENINDQKVSSMLIDTKLPKKRKSNAKNPVATKRVPRKIGNKQNLYLPKNFDKMKLNFDESSCSSNSNDYENFPTAEKKDSNLFTKDKEIQRKRQRKAANERERKRMSGINKAFENLKEKISDGKVLKLSKMEILRLAQNYIIELSHKLNTPITN